MQDLTEGKAKAVVYVQALSGIGVDCSTWQSLSSIPTSASNGTWGSLGI